MRTDTWSISCRISKQRMSLSSTIAATMDDELVSPEGTQEGKNSCHLAAIRLQPIPTVSPEETQDLKMGLWPQIAEMHIKGMISVSPNSCIFPDTEKH